MQRLPFASTVVASRDDPFTRFERAQSFAQAWGSEFIDYGARGHINAESGLGDWPEGRALLARLQSPTP
jgi:predicted alpha/beta hydrolase family esterase